MGDLLFKLDPPVMSCAPDITFVPLEKDVEYVVLACTDGVWDHLKASNAEQQHSMTLAAVSRILNGDVDSTIASFSNTQTVITEVPLENTPYSLKFKQRLDFAAKILVQREDNILDPTLFWNQLSRYDDATAQVIHLAPQEWSAIE
jgi:hypothetical protein